MGRRSGYSLKAKMKAIRDYQSGERGLTEIASNVQCDESTVRQWLFAYRAFGESGLRIREKNRSYTKETKLSAINDYLEGQGSLREIAAKYGVTTKEMLRKWVIKYNNHEDIEDYDPKGEVYMAKSRKTAFEERLEIVKHCINNGKQYKLTAEFFGLPYSLIYGWTNKYLENGEEALRDRRGQKRPEEIMTEEDKLRRELAREKARNQRLETELGLIKKKHEIEVRLGSRKSGKKRDT